MEEEGDLQDVWTYFYLGGMAPYSYSSLIPSGLDRSWGPLFPPHLMCRQCKLPLEQESAHTNARLPPSSASDIRIVSSSNWNLSISCSKEEEEAVPSLMIASLSGTFCNGWATRGIPCGIGWSIGGRSYGARKSGRETSIHAKRWSPAQIELPTSRNGLEIGSKPKIR